MKGARRRRCAVPTWTAAPLRLCGFDRSLVLVATSLAGKLSRRSGQRHVNQVFVAAETQESGAYSGGRYHIISRALITAVCGGGGGAGLPLSARAVLCPPWASSARESRLPVFPSRQYVSRYKCARNLVECPGTHLAFSPGLISYQKRRKDCSHKVVVRDIIIDNFSVRACCVIKT